MSQPNYFQQVVSELKLNDQEKTELSDVIALYIRRSSDRVARQTMSIRDQHHAGVQSDAMATEAIDRKLATTSEKVRNAYARYLELTTPLSAQSQ